MDQSKVTSRTPEVLRSWELVLQPARAAVERGEYDRAQELLDGSQILGDEPLTIVHLRGFLLYKKGDFRNAVTFFNAVIDADPKQTWPRYFRILSNVELGRVLHILSDCLVFIYNRDYRPPQTEFDYIVETYSRLVDKIIEMRPKYVDVVRSLIAKEQPKKYNSNPLGVTYTSGSMATLNLLVSTRKFSRTNLTARPILITSIRKAMTHAVRNIFAHVLGGEKLFFPFIDHTLSEEQFSCLRAEGKQIFVGHVERTLEIEEVFKEALIVLVMRDPASCVHSRAVHFFNPETTDEFSQCVQRMGSIEIAYHYAIYGGTYRNTSFPALFQEYNAIALAWLQRADLVLRYEDLRSPAAETTLLAGLWKLFGSGLPEDIAERIKAGLDPNLSASYVRQGIKADRQRDFSDVINTAMPGMRRLLGYSIS